MKNKLTIFFLVLTAIVTQSCSVDTPEDYFAKTTLNVNKYISIGAKDFQHMVDAQSQGGLYAEVDGKFVPSDSYESHVKTYKISNIETDIENIKKLKPTDDTKEMINASLEVFNFVKSKYETDYIKIAKLLDEKVDKQQIDAAIRKFEEQNLEEFNKKIDVLYSIAMPYAKNNGIKVSLF